MCVFPLQKTQLKQKQWIFSTLRCIMFTSHWLVTWRNAPVLLTQRPQQTGFQTTWLSSKLPAALSQEHELLRSLVLFLTSSNNILCIFWCLCRYKVSWFVGVECCCKVRWVFPKCAGRATSGIQSPTTAARFVRCDSWNCVMFQLWFLKGFFNPPLCLVLL